jgi:predicted amidohydrolase YtcJ
MADTTEHGDQQQRSNEKAPTGVSRRGLIIGGGAAVAATALGVAAANQASAGSTTGRPPIFTAPRLDESDRDLLLINGKIHTMDDQESVVDAVRMRRGRIVAVGHDAQRAGGQAERINLGGRTVVPGLLESHTHFVSLANRPGYHTAQWELAETLDELLAVLAARRPDVPDGQFITAMGAGTPRMFAPDRRLPFLAEIDAVVNDRPVFLYQGGGGPARVNTLGRQFFESVSNPTVTVAADGSLAGANANAALYHLRIRQTFEDKKRSALDAMRFSAQVGLTTNLDQVLPPPNAWVSGSFNPALLEPQPNHALFQLNHYRMYDAWLELHREDQAFVRLQINFLHNQGFVAAIGPIEEMSKQLPELRERLRNQFPNHGDDMVRSYGIGEWGAVFAAPSNPNGYAVWLEAQRLIAQAGWRNENSQAGQANIETVLQAYEQMDAEFGIKHLRWGLQHGDLATPDQLARLKALNCGVSTSGFRWLGGTPQANGAPVGPLFPQLVDSGIPLGLHEDGVHIAPHNPWFALHYATTGLNILDQQINPGQQVSRQQAMHMYTRGNAWYLGREHELGSIETGKLADLVVLDKDYFTVSDAEMRRIRPVMTVINGKVVHDTGALEHQGRG